MTATVLIGNASAGPLAAPQFSNIVKGVTKSRTLPVVDVDPLLPAFTSASKLGGYVSINGTALVGSQKVIAVDTLLDATRAAWVDTTSGAYTLTLQPLSTVPLNTIVSVLFAVDGGDLTLKGTITNNVGSYAQSIGAVVQTGAGPAVSLAGTAAADYSIRVKITLGGALNVGEYDWSTDGGATWVATGVTLPAGGTAALGATGLTATFAAGTYVLNTTYDFAVIAAYAGVTVTELIDGTNTVLRTAVGVSRLKKTSATTWISV